MKAVAFLMTLLSVVTLESQAQDKVVITRTLHGVAHENNQIHYEIQDEQVQVSYPMGHKLHKQKMQYQTQSDSARYFLENLKSELSQADLKHQLKVSHARYDMPLFYASENDDFLVQVWEKDELQWSFEFNDWHQLNFHYKRLSPDWQFLISGINAIFTEQQHKAQSIIRENDHE